MKILCFKLSGHQQDDRVITEVWTVNQMTHLMVNLASNFLEASELSAYILTLLMYLMNTQN
jgi:hypothetical protein